MSGQPKIHDDRIPDIVAPQHNILKLEIAVHDSLFVDVLERSEQIEQEDRDVLVGDGVSLFL